MIMPRACIALRLRARLCRFATATTEGVVNGAAGVEERKGRWIRTSGSAREEIEKSWYPVGVQLILYGFARPRDRWFADSPLEGDRLEPSLFLQNGKLAPENFTTTLCTTVATPNSVAQLLVDNPLFDWCRLAARPSLLRNRRNTSSSVGTFGLRPSRSA